MTSSRVASTCCLLVAIVSLAVLSHTAQAFTSFKRPTAASTNNNDNSNYYDDGTCDINCYTNRNGNYVVVGTTSVSGSYQYSSSSGSDLCVPDGYTVESDISDSLKLAVKCSNLYANGLNTGQCKPYCWAGSA